MDLFLDPTLKGAKTSELFEQLREAIVSGRLEAGDRLPPTREVAGQLAVSRSTITTVYGRLAAEGYIEGRAGAGSYVSPGLSSASRSLPQPAALEPVVRAPPSAGQWALTGFEETPPKFDLRTGRPDPALFPLVEWRRCMTTAMQTAPGAYVDPAGLPGLRRAIAQWVGRSRAVEATADQVIITSGAQQGIDLVTRLLVVPGQTVAVEDPGYPPVAALLAASGVEVLPVPVDSQGIVVDQIPTRARLVYTTPSHQAPTGVTMSMERRRELLHFAEQPQRRHHRRRLRLRVSPRRPTPRTTSPVGPPRPGHLRRHLLQDTLAVAASRVHRASTATGRSRHCSAVTDRLAPARHTAGHTAALHRRWSPRALPAPHPKDLQRTPPDRHRLHCRSRRCRTTSRPRAELRRTARHHAASSRERRSNHSRSGTNRRHRARPLRTVLAATQRARRTYYRLRSHPNHRPPRRPGRTTKSSQGMTFPNRAASKGRHIGDTHRRGEPPEDLA